MPPATRRMTSALHDEEDAEHEHDAGQDEDDHLVEQQRETRQPSGGDRHEFNSGKVRADRQNGVGLKQCSAVEKPREGRPMGHFVEVVEDERAAEHIGGLEPETEDDRDPDALVPRSGGTGEAPGARGEDECQSRQEERHDRRLVTCAAKGVPESPPSTGRAPTIATTDPRRDRLAFRAVGGATPGRSGVCPLGTRFLGQRRRIAGVEAVTTI